MVCMGEGASKPSPEPTLRALQQLGVDSGVIIGDTVDDVVSGVKAGIFALGVPAPAVEDKAAIGDLLLRHGALQVLSVGLPELAELAW